MTFASYTPTAKEKRPKILLPYNLSRNLKNLFQNILRIMYSKNIVLEVLYNSHFKTLISLFHNMFP